MPSGRRHPRGAGDEVGSESSASPGRDVVELAVLCGGLFLAAAVVAWWLSGVLRGVYPPADR